MPEFSEFFACKIKHLKFTEEIKLFLIYPTFTVTSLQFLWTPAEVVVPPASTIRPVMKIKVHDDSGHRDTRHGTVSYSKHQSSRNKSLFFPENTEHKIQK